MSKSQKLSWSLRWSYHVSMYPRTLAIGGAAVARSVDHILGHCLPLSCKQGRYCSHYIPQYFVLYYGFKSFAKPNKTSQQRRVSCILSVIYCTNIQANQEQSIVKQSSLRAEKLCEAINDFVDCRRDDTYFISHARTPSINKKSKLTLRARKLCEATIDFVDFRNMNDKRHKPWKIPSNSNQIQFTLRAEQLCEAKNVFTWFQMQAIYGHCVGNGRALAK